MGLNTKHSINASFLERWITVGKMKEILSEMDDEWELLPNGVGNLSVFTENHEMKGYIDVSEETFEPHITSPEP